MLKKIFLLFSITLIISACTSASKLKNTTITNPNSFTGQLSAQYMKLANSEADQFNFKSANLFANKAIDAANGIEVAPEDFTKWQLLPEYYSEFNWSLKRLYNILKPDVKKHYPDRLAKIQTLYDCWVEQQEENWQTDDIEHCRMEFLLNITELEHDLSLFSKKYSKQDFIENVNNTNIDDSFTQFQQIYFAHDKYKLDKEAIRKIDAISKELKKLIADYTVEVSGYTDTTGKNDYNIKLSKKRAESVSKALIKRGIDSQKIQENYYGETSPAINSGNNKPERRNRRVEINIINE